MQLKTLDLSYDTIKKIQRQNIRQILHQNKKAYQRAKNYRELIKQEIQKKLNEKKKHEKEKQKQRLILDGLIKQNKQQNNKKKHMKMEQQQIYNLQNKILMRKRRNKTQQLISQRQHPFAALLDGQINRKKNWKLKQQQGKLVNHSQLNLKAYESQKRKQQQKQQMKIYENYVQNLNKKNQEQIKIKKLKVTRNLLTKKSEIIHDQEDIDNQAKILNKKYLEQLIQQAQKKKKSNRNYITSNNHKEFILKPNQIQFQLKCSPAFIGQVVCRRQRKQQLDMIDKHLGLQPQKRLKAQKNLQSNTIIQEKSVENVAQNLNQYLYNKHKRFKSMIEFKQNQNIRNLQNIQRVNGQSSAKKVEVILPERQTKQMKSYDFISGETKIYTVKI